MSQTPHSAVMWRNFRLNTKETKILVDDLFTLLWTNYTFCVEKNRAKQFGLRRKKDTDKQHNMDGIHYSHGTTIYMYIIYESPKHQSCFLVYQVVLILGV